MTYVTPANLTSIPALFNYANTVSGGSFYVLVPVSFWLVLFLYLKGSEYATGDAVLAASFASMILTVFLFVFGSLETKVLVVLIAMLGVSSLWAYWWQPR